MYIYKNHMRKIYFNVGTTFVFQIFWLRQRLEDPIVTSPTTNVIFSIGGFHIQNLHKMDEKYQATHENWNKNQFGNRTDEKIGKNIEDDEAFEIRGLKTAPETIWVRGLVGYQSVDVNLCFVQKNGCHL